MEVPMLVTDFLDRAVERLPAQGSDPRRSWTAHIPATVPGTPTARCPTTDLSVRLPSSSRYMSRVAAAGAFSR